MADFFVLDTENCGLGGKMNGERLQKKPSLGSVVRKRLSDITNSLNSPNQDEGLSVSTSAKGYIEQLHKENMVLMRLLTERNKIIELTGAELSKLRVNMKKLQEQNWHLAQANSKMLMEVNIGKDRLKAMHHELGCKNALAKSFELQEKVKKGPCQKVHNEEEGLKKPEEVKGTSNRNKRRQSRFQAPGSSAVTEQVAMEDESDDKRQSEVSKSEQPESSEEKAENKRLSMRRQSTRFKVEVPEPTDEKTDSKRLSMRRQSTRFKCEVPEPTDEKADKADNKRLCVRRLSTKLKSEVPEPTDENDDDKRIRLRRHSTRSEQPKPTEDLFEIEDTNFPLHPLLDKPMLENGLTSSDSSTIKEEKNERSSLMYDTPESRRSSIARPTRRAAVKVQSYKEVPLNVKMRRSE